MGDEKLLSGNEAIALGSYQAGVRVGTGYPGTPSTEILEALTKYRGVYTEWSINEKVALEIAVGSSLAGARTLVTMKHVGLNVASDPLFTASYVGLRGGLVIACADDPGMHSSQNEQDNRHYAYAAKVPLLEPSDSQEAKDFTRFAFDLSERYDTPVIVRSTTRISHSRCVVKNTDTEIREATETPDIGFIKNPKKYVMIPAYARYRHIEVEKRMEKLKKDVNTFDINRMEIASRQIGFITSGISYCYLKEVFPEASVLKLGITNPLPELLIRKFFNEVDRVIVLEELDPYLEIRIRAMGYDVEGKKYFPITGELDPDTVRKGIEKAGYLKEKKLTFLSSEINNNLPPRPPALCNGCPHRYIFKTLQKTGAIITGDIGCYTLGALPPYNAMDTCIEMGGSIGVAQGIEIAEGFDPKRPIVAVIGDSTFAHSGITGLVNSAYNGRKVLIIVLDNGTTAMTGMQPNPLSGMRINGEETVTLDYEYLAKSVSIDDDCFRIVDAYKEDEISKAIEEFTKKDKLCLLVIKGLCVILRRKMKKK